MHYGIFLDMVLAPGERSRSPHNDDFDSASASGAGLGFQGATRGRSGIAGTQSSDVPPGQPSPPTPQTMVDMGQVDKVVSDAINKQIGTFRDSMAAALDGPIRGVVADACSAQLAAVDGRLSALESGQSELLAEVAKIQKAIAKMAHSPSAPDLSSASVASQSVAADVTAAPFWRKPDPTILFINVHGRVKVNIRTIYAAVVRLASEANIPESDYRFNGDNLDNLFDLKFTGVSANQQCLQFYQSLQLGRGRWKEQSCKDPNGVSCKFYIAPDKNPAQVRKEVLSKQLKGRIEGLEGWSKEIFIRKSSGTLLVDRRALVSVAIIDEVRASLVWSHAQRIHLGIEQEVVEAMFKDIVGGGAGGGPSL